MAARASAAAAGGAAKKKGGAEAKEEVRVMSAEELVAGLLAQSEAQLAASEATRGLVEGAAAQGRRNELDALARQIALDEATRAAGAAAALLRISPDPGDADDRWNPRWEAESEPPRCEMDRWARGVVPLKKRSKATLEQPALDLNAKRGSIASVQPRSVVLQNQWESASRASKAAKSAVSAARPVSARGDRAAGTAAAVEVGGATSKGAKAADGSAQAARTAKPELIPVTAKREDDEAERIRQRELKKLAAQMRAKAKEAEEARRVAEEEERLEKIRRDLKGKEWTLDAQGNIILVEPPKAESLPPLASVPRCAVKDVLPAAPAAATEQGQAAPADAAAAKVPQAPAARGSKQPAKANPSSPAPPSSVSGVAAPSASVLSSAPANIIELIEPAPGVTVRDAATGAVRSKPLGTNSQKQLTRSKYLQQLDSRAKTSGVKRDPSKKLEPEGDAPTVSGKAAGALQAPPAPPVAVAQIAAPPTPQSAASEASAATGEVKATESKSGSASKSPQVSKLLSPVDKFNGTILADPSWGINPSERSEFKAHELPPHGEPDDREQTLGPEAKSPRERAFTPRDFNQRKHLPPPLFPARAGSGHGFVTSYLAPSNPSSPVAAALKAVEEPRRVPFQVRSRDAVQVTEEAQRLLGTQVRAHPQSLADHA